MSEGTPRTAKVEVEADEGMETLSGYRGSTGVCLGNRQARANSAAGFSYSTGFRALPSSGHIQTTITAPCIAVTRLAAMISSWLRPPSPTNPPGTHQATTPLEFAGLLESVSHELNGCR